MPPMQDIAGIAFSAFPSAIIDKKAFVSWATEHRVAALIACRFNTTDWRKFRPKPEKPKKKRLPTVSRKQREELKTLFGMFDREGTGTMAVSEMMETAREAFPHMTDDDAQRHFKKFRKNPNKRITFQQFVTFYRQAAAKNG